jgi:hypothetical protein
MDISTIHQYSTIDIFTIYQYYAMDMLTIHNISHRYVHDTLVFHIDMFTIHWYSTSMCSI